MLTLTKEKEYAKHIEVAGGKRAGFDHERTRLGRTNFCNHRNRWSYWSLLSNRWCDLRLHVEGENIDGDLVSKMVVLHMGESAPGKARLDKAGLELRTEKSRVYVDMVAFDSHAEKAGIDFDWEILSLQVPKDRPAKQWMYLPALFLLGSIIILQRKRVTGKI